MEVLVTVARYALHSDVERSTYNRFAVHPHRGNGYPGLVEVGKSRQKVGYFPGACLDCASLICHDTRWIYGKRTLCNLLGEGCTRAYRAKSERVISR